MMVLGECFWVPIFEALANSHGAWHRFAERGRVGWGGAT